MLSFSSKTRIIRVNCFYILVLFPCFAVVMTILFPAEKFIDFNYFLEKEPKTLKCMSQPLDVFDHPIGQIYQHSSQEDFLSCLFFIEPEKALEPHVLLIGSETMLGISLKKKLAEKHINFGEIREKHQFDLMNSSLIPYLKHVNFSVIINLEGNNIKYSKELINYCRNHEISFINVTNVNYYKTGYFQCIIDVPLWGPSSPDKRDFPNPEIGNLLGQSYRPSVALGDEYVWVNDFAELFAMKVKEIMLNHHISPELKFKVNKIYKREDILNSINAINEQKDLTGLDQDLISHCNEIFEYQQKSIDSFIKPYWSHVTTLSQTRDIMKRFNITMSVISDTLKDYPDISFELLVVFCAETSGRFADFFSVPSELQKFIRVIEIPYEYVEQTKQRLGISSYPDYPMRNIGIRRARGEYITCGSCDVIPPIGLFDAARYRCFTPISYIRTERILGFGKAKNLTKIHHEQRQFWQYVIFPEKDSGYDLDIYIDACGDLQGMHRDAWHLLKGYIESSYNFNIDAVLAFERASLAGPLYIQYFSGGVHIEHMKVSDQTKHIDPWDENMRSLMTKGELTHFGLFPRLNWGASNYTFE